MPPTCFIVPLRPAAPLRASSFTAPRLSPATSAPQPLPHPSPARVRRRRTQPLSATPSSFATASPSAPATSASAATGTYEAASPSDAPSSSARADPDVRVESLNLLEWPAISARVLAHASTTLGRRILVDPDVPTHLHIPDTQPESERLLALTRELYRLEHDLHTNVALSAATDIAPLVAAAAKGRVLPGAELRAVAATLAVAHELRRAVLAHPTVEQALPQLHELLLPLRTAPPAEREIRRCVDEYGEVVEDADATLRATRDAQRSVAADARTELNALMARHAAAIQERVITTRYDRFVIPVKSSHKAAFRRAVVHDASASGLTAYVEPQSVRPLNDRLRALAAKERAAVHAVLKRLSEDVVAPLLDDVHALCHVVATVDAAAARARCARTYHGVDVAFDNTKPLNLLGVRHPLLTWKVMDEQPGEEEDGESSSGTGNGAVERQNGVTDEDGLTIVREFVRKREPVWKRAVVPSSYMLPDGARCVCVTGPNTGGKTLSLKTLGVSALLARAGMFIPASPPRLQLNGEGGGTGAHDAGAGSNEVDQDRARVLIPYFDSVLADIGDDQSLVQSLSTFSGHVRRIKRILSATTPNALVLLDEIGSGTDPAEGAALGIAILRHLAVDNRAALTFATTHHGELKTLKYATDGTGPLFENASVEFDDVALAPTFRLVWGVPGRSNALSIARRLGLHGGVVDAAEGVLRGDGDDSTGGARVDVETLIAALEADKRAAEDARRDAESALAEIAGRRDELADRLARLRDGEIALRKEQRVAMDAEVAAAKKQIAKMIRDMQQGGGSAQAAARAAERLGSMQMPGAGSKQADRRTDPAPRGRKISVDELAVGDRVNVGSLGATDVPVVEIANAREVIVGVGAMRAKVKVRDIDSVSSAKAEPVGDEDSARNRRSDGGDNAKTLAVRTSANTVDIRGERVDPAEVKVGAAIDRALAVGTLWVVHGHGTGRLRDGIRKFLAAHPLVERVRDAERHDGGSGCSVVELK